jgi:hypothetical protein
VFTVANNFFSKHKLDCDLSALDNEDFEALVRLCVTSDTVLIEDKAYKQRSGLAMGNNLAPTLAIIYMNDIDSLVTEKFNGLVNLKRYIDDYFAFLLSRQISFEGLLAIANDQNDAIKFTLEQPVNNQLPFLDTMVSFNPNSNTFSTSLYIKPIHSRCIVPWSSHGSVASKRAILIGEIKRAITNSSNSKALQESLARVTELFTNNGYPRHMIKAIIRSTIQNTNRPTTEEHEHIYIKIPFIDEEFKRRALGVVRRSGVPNIRIHFENGKPLSKVFAPPRSKPLCPKGCETCTLTDKPNRCLYKNVVYQITCTICGIVYIGETSRTIGTRVKEHLTMNKQTVYKHISNHTNSRRRDPKITWKILHNNIRNHGERKYVEAVEIQKNTHNIMNGCIGRTICI